MIQENEDDLLPDSFRRSPRGNRIRRAAEEKHQPGSIVRISVRNFVTYTKATFNCGPNLNMIIGPNGTGKSTLVCAICLGLGSKPGVLGRSKDIGEYVKHGHKEAEIEVELAGKEGKTNEIIQHTIKRDGNKSTWKINGQQTTHKQVVALVRTFSIQIDNLCQFLPQDRVVEFASMSPVGLLESTQKAAAREQMGVWHAQLKQLGHERLNMRSKNAEDAKSLASLERRHAAQQGEVDKIREREKLEIRLQGLKMAKPAQEYKEKRLRIQDIKKTKKELERDLRELEEQVAPALQIVKDTENRVTQLKASVGEGKTFLTRFDATLDNKLKAIGEKKTEINQCEIDHNAAVTEHKQRVLEIQKLDQEIKKNKHMQEQEPVAFNPADFNDRIREQDGLCRDIVRDTADIKENEANIKERTKARNAERTALKGEMTELQSASGQVTAKLKSVSDDSAKAYSWLMKNTGRFKEKIYGPPLVECQVKDQRYAAALESVMGRNDLLSFTATNRDDWKLFLDICQNQLRLKDITVKVTARSLSSWQPPIPKEELRNYGLEDFAIDFISGPDPVLAMLCDGVRLHRTGVSLEDISDAQFERLKESPVSHFVTASNSYRINRRREYGPSAVSTMVTQIKPARNFTAGNAVDTDAYRQLNERLKDIERDLAALEDEAEPIKEQLAELKRKHDFHTSEKQRISEEKSEHQRAYNTWKDLPRKLGK